MSVSVSVCSPLFHLQHSIHKNQDVSRMFQERFKGVSRKTEGCFEGDLIKGGFKDISKQFKGCCKEPSMVV